MDNAGDESLDLGAETLTPTMPPPAEQKSGAGAAHGRVWLVIAIISLGANAALGWTLWRRPARAAAAAAAAAPAAASSTAKPAGELAAYAALGSFVAETNRVPDLHWTEAQFNAFANGLRASYEGRGYAMDDDARRLRDEINARVQKMLQTDRPDPVQEYFRTLREKEHVQQTASGLHYRITEQGAGKQPGSDSTVLMSYSARLPSGEALASLSRTRVRTAVGDLLPGLREGVQLLHVGGKALVYVPADLSFGNGDWPPGVPRGAPIIFFVELHEVE